jgi:hypothetical protein
MFKKIFFSSLVAILFFVFFTALSTKEAMAAACGIFKKGNVTVGTAIAPATSCFISADTIEGVDTTAVSAETGGGNTAVLTIDKSVTLQSGVNGTTTLAVGSLSIVSGGSLITGSVNSAIKTGNGLWVTDADADGWAAAFATANRAIATASGKRRLGHMKSDTTVDCLDSANSGSNTCYSYSQSAYYAYAYSQGSYWRYSYSQSAYWRYSQGTYWRYAYSQGYYCFLPNTKILLGDGTYKEIWQIKVGDEVQSYDTQTERMSKSKVAEVIVHPDVLGQHLLINNRLQVTLNHPILINGQWKEAGMAKVGDTMVNAGGKAEVITSLEISNKSSRDLYNLHLTGSDHNYFADDVLVHNK